MAGCDSEAVLSSATGLVSIEPSRMTSLQEECAVARPIVLSGVRTGYRKTAPVSQKRRLPHTKT